ncbi:MAG: hydroxyphenylacetyl-CoA thioesterase PaaI [Planktotalea sp.]|uniref:hydroxyphenylacetyl-CoA thioesterase PaaI n=1 Tax=Planktotalea sp. TaxID=2029877 RepID=UPI003C767B6C
MTPDERAARASAAMWANDRASPWLGIEMGEVREGFARMTLKVENHHCNGHDICHGGVIFTLADSCFAFACNSRNQNTVAQNNMITFIAPGQLGDVLTAEAHETALNGRNGIYDVRVSNQDGRTIAEMRGLSRAIKGQLFDEEQI